MRPRHWCRGRPSRVAPTPAHAPASMRPRHWCRGRHAERRRPADAPAHPASMRPRHWCRGRLGARSASRRRPCRFNEAPALVPGKARAAGGTVAGIGASMRPRHWCRGRRRAGLASLPPRQASMRPRHWCRGRLVLILKDHVAHDRFNEAPALVPGKAAHLDCRTASALWKDFFERLPLRASPFTARS